jgi:hypothetical protein
MTTLKLAIFAAAFATVSAGLANAEQWKTTCVGTLNVRKSEIDLLHNLVLTKG